MKGVWSWIAIPVLAAVVPVARAADMATLGCLEQSLDPAVRTTLVADIEANLGNPDRPSTYRPETQAGIRAAVGICREKHGWSERAAFFATVHLIPAVGWPLVDRVARNAKLDPLIIERRFLALPRAEQIGAIDDDLQLNRPAIEKVAQASLAAKEIVDENATLAGALFGLLALREWSRHRFAAA